MKEDLIKEGMKLKLKYGDGIVCFKGELNGKHYINVVFEAENIQDLKYQIYEVIFEEDGGVTFIENNDSTVYEQLAATWAAEELINYKKNPFDFENVE